MGSSQILAGLTALGGVANFDKVAAGLVSLGSTGPAGSMKSLSEGGAALLNVKTDKTVAGFLLDRIAPKK